MDLYKQNVFSQKLLLSEFMLCQIRTRSQITSWCVSNNDMLYANNEIIT